MSDRQPGSASIIFVAIVAGLLIAIAFAVLTVGTGPPIGPPGRLRTTRGFSLLTNYVLTGFVTFVVSVQLVLALAALGRGRAGPAAGASAPAADPPGDAFVVIPSRQEEDLALTLDALYDQQGFAGWITLVVIVDGFPEDGGPRDASLAVAWLAGKAGEWRELAVGALVGAPATDPRLPHRLVAARHHEGDRRRVLVWEKAWEGKAGALNFGLDVVRRLTSRGDDLVVTIDSDSVLNRDALARLDAGMRAEGLDAASGLVAVFNGRASWATRWQNVEYLFLQHVYRGLQAGDAAVLTIPGPVFAVRRGVLDDPATRAFARGRLETVVEDSDFTAALLERRRRVGFVADALSWTACKTRLTGRAGLGQQRKRWFFGQFQVYDKHRRGLREANRAASRWMGFMTAFYGTVGLLGLVALVAHLTALVLAYGISLAAVSLSLRADTVFMLAAYFASRVAILVRFPVRRDLDEAILRRGEVASNGRLLAHPSFLLMPFYEIGLSVLSAFLFAAYLFGGSLTVWWRGKRWWMRGRPPYIRA